MQLDPLAQIDPLVIAAVVVIFTATYFVLRKLFISPVIDVMERRFAYLEEAEVVRAQAAEAIQEAETEAQEVVSAAAAKAEAILEHSRGEAGRERQTRLEAARDENAVLLDEGRREIMEAREAELAKLREETTVCVTIACDKLLRGADAGVISSVVDRLVAKRVH